MAARLLVNDAGGNNMRLSLQNCLMRNHGANSKGQILVVMTLAIVALIGAATLSSDVAVFYYNWMLLQRAADSAAVAGASYLPSDTTTAQTTANNIARLNGIQAAEITSTTIAPDNKSITVILQRQVSYFFGQVLGLTTGMVGARATAGVEAVSSVNGLVPIGVDSRTVYTYGQQVDLETGQYGPGNWGALAMGGNGASIFRSNLQYGYTGKVSIGDQLATETGVIAGPTNTAFDARVSAGLSGDPNGTLASHTLDDARVITVPLVDFANINGKSTVEVKGFAELWLVSMDKKGTITTSFIQQVSGGVADASAPSDGAMQTLLLQ